MAARRGRLGDGLLLEVLSSITDRDKQILRLLRWHRVLTTSQIHAMFFGDLNTTQHRMTRLFDLRLVARFRPLRAGRNAEYHYVLDAAGAYVVAAMAGRGEEVNLRWRTEQALSIALSSRLAHTVGVNDLFVRLTAAARHDPDAWLERWWSERYAAAYFDGMIRPDGIGIWREGSRVVSFCLEYDRGTEQLSRLAAKAEGYQTLERALGRPFWVFVAVPGSRREAGARAALADSGLAVATTTYDGAKRPTEAVWAPPGPIGQRVRLIELAGWPRPAGSRQRLAEGAEDERRLQGKANSWETM